MGGGGGAVGIAQGLVEELVFVFELSGLGFDEEAVAGSSLLSGSGAGGGAVGSISYVIADSVPNFR